jgi:hypothetical protein
VSPKDREESQLHDRCYGRYIGRVARLSHVFSGWCFGFWGCDIRLWYTYMTCGVWMVYGLYIYPWRHLRALLSHFWRKNMEYGAQGGRTKIYR